MVRLVVAPELLESHLVEQDLVPPDLEQRLVKLDLEQPDLVLQDLEQDLEQDLVLEPLQYLVQALLLEVVVQGLALAREPGLAH